MVMFVCSVFFFFLRLWCASSVGGGVRWLWVRFDFIRVRLGRGCEGNASLITCLVMTLSFIPPSGFLVFAQCAACHAFRLYGIRSSKEKGKKKERKKDAPTRRFDRFSPACFLFGARFLDEKQIALLVS